jgi:small-conductance mechanosensitive channel
MEVRQPPTGGYVPGWNLQVELTPKPVDGRTLTSLQIAWGRLEVGAMELLRDALVGLGWLPPWALSLILLATSLSLALVIHFLAVRLIARTLHPSDAFWRSFLVRTRSPTRIAMALVALWMATPLAPLSEGQLHVLRHLFSIGLIVLLGWVGLIALDLGAALYVQKFRHETDSPLARKHLTQVRILRRAVATLVIVVTAALALMTIEGVRQWGVSLLAAGGAASLIVGLALQPLLSNLIAGIQIAVTQPIRIGDEVNVQGESGSIEEIRATYVVVRLWDWRRLVVPLNYFNQNAFQNNTRESTALIGTVMLYVDYEAPIDKLRARFEEIVRGSPRWDGQVMSLAVTDAREQTVEVRCLVSARNGGETFELRAEVREKLIAFMRDELPEALPHRRHMVEATGPFPPAAPGPTNER